MKLHIRMMLLCTVALLPLCTIAQDNDYARYRDVIKKHIYKDFKGMYRPAGKSLQYPFITPGSVQYADVLWDWDSWLSNIALRQILTDTGSEADKKEAVQYEQGCILNFLAYADIDGWVPIMIERTANLDSIRPKNIYEVNMHKPCLAQHAAFLTKENKGDVAWLRDKFHNLQFFVGGYKNRYRHAATGLYFWQNDIMIGVDNDPSTYYRPDRSSASIYLNCLMYKELKAMVYLCEQLKMDEIAKQFATDAEELKQAIQTHCWDERDGFFYSVDLNLKPVNTDTWAYHGGAPRHWDGVIQRIGVWSGFLALWAEIATPEQAKRMVNEHYKNSATFNANYGVRTLSKMEKMYNLKASGNPSSWLGPIWGISNYMTWRGLVNYGFQVEAKELATKTILLFGKDFERHGTLHEYYQPENGEPILNPGFQNWNYLVLNMLNWMDGSKVVTEF
ncbi:glycoside hydrolase family 37 [Sphingobacterium olei]|uniref:Glycoside hydrolase family 37 n=1 Tax=Sphingobacterium olei TaxID=2571155 RepID=A0A4U0NYP6_9SPHI|nr:trehalase family glycosidase [Sphingobacterium olei]TJZ59996.1 glycoside hydrolase family 37 [Sphingobacterium olei]